MERPYQAEEIFFMEFRVLIEAQTELKLGSWTHLAPSPPWRRPCVQYRVNDQPNKFYQIHLFHQNGGMFRSPSP